ncbi:aminoglycoside phosphotransferase [Rathayibacter sp. AY1G1]|uniref:phosphotransferase n=1 Tax=Rathayibacter sp. AY1G1 TaxID=2080564 RepID=UPI000CE75207|nr:phosphotransferase [Rathayibacter sp. AY1G1]PPH08585.1 aminoglycoside phosphotransferase [Rathayibacter sp. AY1G1]
MVRTTWANVPGPVRRAFEDAIGGEVVSASSQSGGFSSGGADRLVLAGGRRVFAKSISRARNVGTFELHRREAVVVRDLPASVPAPGLVGMVEQDDWVVVAFEDVDGRHSESSESAAVLDALAALPRVDHSTLPRLSDELTPDASSWDRLATSGSVGELDPWIGAHLDRLREASARLPQVVEGEHLVHLDCRADNLLIDANARVWLVDWPWACIGASWFDGVTYLLDVLVRNPDGNAEGLLEHPSLRRVPADAIDSVLAGLAGSWIETLREPPPEDMPTIREFQRREATAALQWLRRRWA